MIFADTFLKFKKKTLIGHFLKGVMF